VLLERFKVALELLKVVTHNLSVIIIIDHINVAKVLARVPLMLSIDLNDLIDGITGAIQVHTLAWFPDAIVLLILAAVHLDDRRSIAAIEAGVLTGAEVVELMDHVVEVLAESVKDDGELTLLLLHVHEEAEERWDQVELSLVVQFSVHFTLGADTSLLSGLGWVDILVFLFAITFLLFFIAVCRHRAILSDAKLLTCTFRQRQSLEHFLELVLKLSSGATWPSKLLDQSHPRLICSLVEASVLELLARIHRLNVFHVSDDVVRGIFALGDASSQGEALWLCPAQLVVGKSPLRLLLRLSTRLDILDHKLAPGALADDMAHVIDDTKTASVITNHRRVVDIKVENVTTF